MMPFLQMPPAPAPPPGYLPLDAYAMALDDPSGIAMAQGLPSLPGSAAASDAMLGALDDDSLAVHGARSAATSLGIQSNLLTEFTKRKNWPAKVVEELRDLLVILDANGRVIHVSPSITPLTGFEADYIIGQRLQDFIHIDDVGVFVAELNESIANGTPLRLFYRMKKKDDSYVTLESLGHAHIAAAKFAPNPNNQSPFCQAVFMMSRPYPTRNAALLDSFLEHKIENERLKRRIAELRREEADDLEETQMVWQQGQQSAQEGRSDVTRSEGAVPTPSANLPTLYPAPVSDESAAARHIALTRENLEGMAGGQLDSIRDKMARYEGQSHGDTIELLTGLRYMEGERSRGISTGSGSPKLIKGDAGIALPLDRDPRTGEKKKTRVPEEYVCTDCGKCSSRLLHASLPSLT